MLNHHDSFCGYCGLPHVGNTFCDDVCEELYTTNLSPEHVWFEKSKIPDRIITLDIADLSCLMGAADAYTRERYSREVFAYPHIKMTHEAVWELHAWVSSRKHTAGITISRSVSHIVSGPFKSIPRMLTINNLLSHPRIVKEDKARLMAYMFANTHEAKYISKEVESLFVF